MNRTLWVFSAVMLFPIGSSFAYALETHQKPEPTPHARHEPEKGKAPSAEQTKPPATIAIGAEVDGALALLDPSGRTELLKDLRGKTVVLHFFGSHAASSTACVTRLKALQEAYGAKGVELIGVDSNADDFDAADAATLKRVEAWAKQNGLARVMFDKNHVLADRLHATVNGHTFVVDGKGILRYAGPLDDDAKGEHPDRANDLVRAAIDAVLAGKSPEHATAPPVGDPIVRAAKSAPPVAKKEPPAKREPPKKDGTAPGHKPQHHG